MNRQRREPEPLMSPQLAVITLAGLVVLAIAGIAIWQFFHDGLPCPGQD